MRSKKEKMWKKGDKKLKGYFSKESKKICLDTFIEYHDDHDRIAKIALALGGKRDQQQISDHISAQRDNKKLPPNHPYKIWNKDYLQKKKNAETEKKKESLSKKKESSLKKRKAQKKKKKEAQKRRKE
jgi:hypothetical protein